MEATSKPIKRRASVACERCRLRKVRCDIVVRKTRCTNCLLDDLECVQPGPRRRRGTSRRFRASLTHQLGSSGTQNNEAEMQTDRVQDNVLPPVEVHEGATQLADAEAAHSTPTVDQETRPLVPDSNEELFPDFISDLLKPSAQLTTWQRSAASHAHDDEDAPESIKRLFPAFTLPIRSTRAQKYVEFLQTQGAFSVPSPKLICALLTRYVECVYPQLPLLDIHNVLQAVATNGGSGKISLLLFQAILLAASAFVDVQSLSDAGYDTRMTFRKQQAERVRLLYDFDCETNRLVLIQSLILMTSWQDKGDEVKHLRHWISIAYNIAVLLGLNKEPSSGLKISQKQKSLRKRIWWSLYMRDRTLALGLRQWPIISDEASEISEPMIGDFQLDPASTEACSMLGDCLLLKDLDQQTRLAEIFIAQLRLSHQVYQVFKARYTVVTPKMGSNYMIALVLVPNTLEHAIHATQSCSALLDEWFKKLPDKLQFQAPLSLHFRPGEDFLVLHCGILNLFYYALVCALHRPCPYTARTQIAARIRNSHRKARHAANAIFSILTEFQASDSIELLPTQGITFMLQGAVTSLCDAVSNVAQVRSLSHRNLQLSLEVLNDLKDSHSYAPYAINFIRAAAANVKRQPPVLSESVDSDPHVTPSPPPEEFEYARVSSLSLNNTQVGTDIYGTELQSFDTSPTRGLGEELDFRCVETPNYEDMGDLSIPCEAISFYPGWEFFLEPV